MLTKQDHKKIITLSRAGLKEQAVQIEYEYLDKSKGRREVILKPTHFVRGVRGGANKLHVVGYDFVAEGIRQLAISNIVSIKPLKRRHA